MKLLIIEDEPKIANSLKTGLEDEQFLVDVAYDGKKGWLMATTGTYDAIILDLMLPGMSGNEILEKLRKEGNSTPVLILTAKGQIDDKVEGLNQGADDYLAKPFAFEELLARVHALIRRATSKEVELRAGNITVNPMAHSVYLDSTPISMRPKEFAILEYLLRHKNRIVSESELLDHIWSDDYTGFSNIVAATMKNLRKKISTPGGEDPIQTVRGLGYVIREGNE